jgi:hypothetical protein
MGGFSLQKKLVGRERQHSGNVKTKVPSYGDGSAKKSLCSNLKSMWKEQNRRNTSGVFSQSRRKREG